MKMITSKKLLILLALSIILSLDLFGQSGWIQQNAGTSGNLGYIEIVDANTGFTGNPLVKTTNGGNNWIPVPGQTGAISVEMVNPNTGYVANYGVYKTTNGGNNWIIVTPPGLNYNYYASFIDDLYGYVGGTGEDELLGMWKTMNGGTNWTFCQVMYAPWPNTLRFNDIKAMTLNTIYCTVYYIDEEPPHYTNRYLYKSVNGGSWFNSIFQNDTLEFLKMSFPSNNTGYVTAVGQSGVSYVFKGVNDNWGAFISLTSNFKINGIDFPNPQTGYAVCDSGIIYKTTNEGINWYILNTGTTTAFSRVDFINPLTGWVVGNNGLILKTTTGGEPPVLNSISGTVRYQDNNEPVTSGYVKAIRYDSAAYNIITVDSAQIQSNGTYILQNCPPITLDIMAYENDEEVLSFVPTYYVSTIYWQYATHVRPDSNLTNINIGAKRTVNPSGNLHISGYIFSNEPYDNTALKDAVLYARLTGSFKGYSISQQNGYYKVDSLPAGIYELIADRMGYTGESYVISLTSSSLENINFYLNNVLVPVKSEEANVPDKYWLYQNYPNPFNPVTKIEFSIPQSSFVTLTVYDLLGREILKLVNEQLQAGTYSAKWNAENYPSGVYFYKLTAGDFVEAKKMILIK